MDLAIIPEYASTVATARLPVEFLLNYFTHSSCHCNDLERSELQPQTYEFGFQVLILFTKTKQALSTLMNLPIFRPGSSSQNRLKPWPNEEITSTAETSLKGTGCASLSCPYLVLRNLPLPPAIFGFPRCRRPHPCKLDETCSRTLVASSARQL